MHKEGNPHSWRPQSKIAFSLEVVNGLCYMSDMRENKPAQAMSDSLLSDKGQQWISRTR